MYSKVIQLFIYIYFFRLLFIRGYYKILNTVPCAIQQILLYFIYSGTHLLVPYSLLLPTFPFGCYWLLKFAKHSYGPQSKHTHTHTHTHTECITSLSPHVLKFPVYLGLFMEFCSISLVCSCMSTSVSIIGTFQHFSFSLD